MIVFDDGEISLIIEVCSDFTSVCVDGFSLNCDDWMAENSGV